MVHIKEFDKNAKTYDRYNIIQKEVAKTLVQNSPSKPLHIVDLGCGSGALYKAIDWKIESFIAVDKSQKMLTLHPDNFVEKQCLDIEQFAYNKYKHYHFFSSAALQWCTKLENVFKNLADKEFTLALFSANTFHSLHKIAGTVSPIATRKAILDAAQKSFKEVKIEIKEYKLKFASTLDMLRYIKKSGVSGGKKVLNYKQTKRLLEKYDKDYLEFEVIFISSLSALSNPSHPL